VGPGVFLGRPTGLAAVWNPSALTATPVLRRLLGTVILSSVEELMLLPFPANSNCRGEEEAREDRDPVA
jgi:hypothetical protein